MFVLKRPNIKEKEAGNGRFLKTNVSIKRCFFRMHTCYLGGGRVKSSRGKYHNLTPNNCKIKQFHGTDQVEQRSSSSVRRLMINQFCVIEWLRNRVVRRLWVRQIVLTIVIYKYETSCGFIKGVSGGCFIFIN